ncbi:MAG TPA: zinc-ribbon domain-containing protein [Nitrososphaera sp.]|nr:zinc-ribbon domain-containing protein [Nitrososphaera sp.]
MFCPACGKQIEETDVFCRYCGNSAKLGASVGPVSAPVAQVQVKNVYAGKKLQVYGAIVTVIGLFVMIGSCVTSSSGSGNWAWTAFLPLIGLVLMLWGGIKHWWHN